MELQLVSYEQAKALKELGFPKDGILQYYQCPYCFYNGYCINIQDDFGEYSKGSILYAPTLELVAKWLRDKKIFITTKVLFIHTFNNTIDEVKYHSEVETISIEGTYRAPFASKLMDSYEEALSAGIDKAIEILSNVK